MLESDYSESTSKHPKVLTDSKGWEKLMEKYIPDKKLAEVHKELLGNEDWRARDSGLDKGYKIKGKFKPQEIKHSGEIITKVSTEELEEYKRYRKEK